MQGCFRSIKMRDFLKNKKNGPDFSEIDSLEKAADAGQTEVLMPMLVMPDSFSRIVMV
jgi:hypothetical protein